MITRISNLKQLPYKTYTAYLLKSEDESKRYESGYLITLKSPAMIVLFIEFIDEIHGKTNNNKGKMVELPIETNEKGKYGKRRKV